MSNAQVSAADLENVRLSQQALLATDYFLLAAQDMQLKVLSDTIEAYEKNLQLTSGAIEAYEKNLQLTINRHTGGVASRSDITLAQTQLAAAKAQSYANAHRASAGRARHSHADRPAAGLARDWSQ